MISRLFGESESMSFGIILPDDAAELRATYGDVLNHVALVVDGDGVLHRTFRWNRPIVVVDAVGEVLKAFK